MRGRITAIACALALLPLQAVMAQDVPTTPEISFSFNGSQIAISQDSDCTGICVAPFQAHPDVRTVGEQEVVDFIATRVVAGTGLLVDSRPSDDLRGGAIATAVNIPTSLLAPSNPYAKDILMALGAEQNGPALTFANALPIVAYDDGPHENDAANLIQLLISNGYPPEKIHYYRGGFLVWTSLGISIEGS